MAARDVFEPDDRLVYRGLRNRNWSKNGRVTYRAFLLRPATDQYPIEEELSLGLSHESAVDELDENFGVAILAIAQIHALPHGLTIRPDPENAQKADLFGLPLHSTDPAQISLAYAMATDLADISEFLPPAPP
jgi:hypothetical protein